MTQTYAAFLAFVFITTNIVTMADRRVAGQERAASRPDLSGRWELNRDLSDDAKKKLESVQSAGGHGPGRHFGGIFGGGQAAHAQLDDVIVNAPTAFVLTQDDEKVLLTEPSGRVRTLPTNNRKVKIDGRDVRTKWENNRLVSEMSVGGAKVIESYERSPNAPQLVVTANVSMRGRQVSIRRIYDAVRK
jgi:hypothetical protein